MIDGIQRLTTGKTRASARISHASFESNADRVIQQYTYYHREQRCSITTISNYTHSYILTMPFISGSKQYTCEDVGGFFVRMPWAEAVSKAKVQYRLADIRGTAT